MAHADWIGKSGISKNERVGKKYADTDLSAYKR